MCCVEGTYPLLGSPSAPLAWSGHPQPVPRDAPRLPVPLAVGKQPGLPRARGLSPNPTAGRDTSHPRRRQQPFAGPLSPRFPAPASSDPGEERGRLLFSCLNEEQGNPKSDPRCLR